jgi:hypothetical protein
MYQAGVSVRRVRVRAKSYNSKSPIWRVKGVFNVADNATPDNR